MITAGGTTYAFQLRRGIRYSNGTLVKASDFRRAFERPFRGGIPEVAEAPLVGSGACERQPRSCDLSRGIRTDDATGTIVFHLRRPEDRFLSELIRRPPIPARLAGPEHGDASGPLDRAVHDRELRTGTGAHARPQSLLPRVVESRAARTGFPDEIQFRLAGPPGVTAVERGQADVDIVSPRRRRTSTRSRSLERATRRRSTCTRSRRRSSSSSIRHILPSTMSGCGAPSTTPSTVAPSAASYGGPEIAEPTCQPRPPGTVAFRRYCPYTAAPGRTGEWKAPDLTTARRLVADLRDAGHEGDDLDVPRLLGAGRRGSGPSAQGAGLPGEHQASSGYRRLLGENGRTRRREGCRQE